MSRRQQMYNVMLISCVMWCAACNETPVNTAINDGTVARKTTIKSFDGDMMDILWVVDNSGSMCQEQRTLRNNFGNFVEVLKNTSHNFHIAVTTTHAPQTDVAKRLEPIARESQLQHIPQPVPGIDRERTCVTPEAIKASLKAALSCVKDPSIATQFEWTDEQIRCAVDRPTADCAQSLGVPDRNNDGTVDTFDLFPQTSDYRAFPRVLKADDYRQDDGTIDAARLKTDFGCISLVGTRGDGYERGLQVAVNAVSPAWTGGLEGTPGSDPTAPNHGFIRKHATFAAIFVTDENDCSAPKGTLDLQSACGADICDYQNAQELAGEPSILSSVESLATTFRTNLAATKGHEVDDGKILMASIHGSWNVPELTMPTEAICQTQNATQRSDGLVSCKSSLGIARSGDRYERFIRQFSNYYPNQVSADDPNNFNLKEVGWMCIGDFSPALTAIAELVTGEIRCDAPDVFECTQDSQCSDQPFTNVPGQCLTAQQRGSSSFQYCNTETSYLLTLDDRDVAAYPALERNPFCVPESIDQLGVGTCIVKPMLYTFYPCSRKGVSMSWKQHNRSDLQRELAGYTLSVVRHERFSGEERMNAYRDSK